MAHVHTHYWQRSPGETSEPAQQGTPSKNTHLKHGLCTLKLQSSANSKASL